jgi:1-acyl-sn-glycerol-3-phosphate acyltransferase
MSDESAPYEDTLDATIKEVFYERIDDMAAENAARNVAETLQSGSSAEKIPDLEVRQQLSDELDQLINRVKQVTPEYTPPPFSPQRLISIISENFAQFSPEVVVNLLQQLRSGLAKDVFDLDTWKGIWYVVNYSIDVQKDLLKRRVTGEYETDDWGYDPEVVDAVKPFFQFLYQRYWRVQVSGIENIPDEGRAFLVSNHSGQLPFDGSMVSLAVFNEHPAQRIVRTLYDSWFSSMPVISRLFVKLGQTSANEENGIRLLEQEQLVAVYPEGYKGIGKLYKDRYRLARFGQGGFVRMALQTGAPMIPVAVVGAEETYISLAKSDFIARLIGIPYFPISPTFPWLGLLGFVPIPTKWYIDIGEPVVTDVYPSESADNLMLVSQLTDQMRNRVQEMVYARLSQRNSVLFG